MKVLEILQENHNLKNKVYWLEQEIDWLRSKDKTVITPMINEYFGEIPYLRTIAEEAKLLTQDDSTYSVSINLIRALDDYEAWKKGER